jgi:hypothetical protein
VLGAKPPASIVLVMVYISVVGSTSDQLTVMALVWLKVIGAGAYKQNPKSGCVSVP